MSKYISVVIPAFNEAENLPSLIKAIQDVFTVISDCSYECLIVDDGSTDDTRTLLAEAAQADPHLRPIHMARNSGQSAALLAGMRLAKGEYILTLDADMQNDPHDFPRIIELLEEYDCVCGYRKKRNDNWRRLFTSRMGNLVRRWIVDDGIRDAGCGTKGFRRICAEHFVPFNGGTSFLCRYGAQRWSNNSGNPGSPSSAPAWGIQIRYCEQAVLGVIRFLWRCLASAALYPY